MLQPKDTHGCPLYLDYQTKLLFTATPQSGLVNFGSWSYRLVLTSQLYACTLVFDIKLSKRSKRAFHSSSCLDQLPIKWFPIHFLSSLCPHKVLLWQLPSHMSCLCCFNHKKFSQFNSWTYTRAIAWALFPSPSSSSFPPARSQLLFSRRHMSRLVSVTW